MGDFNRRTVLAAASVVAATGGVALAQAPAASPKPREKGPRVWLDLDQQELDDAYDQSKYAANLAQIVKRYATNSEAVRSCTVWKRRHETHLDDHRRTRCAEQLQMVPVALWPARDASGS